ncbi:MULTISPECIES: methyltransferase family protein [unclassified Bradyrhizobium]|uniref:methyltransferase family protein n=1 Tax=Bradyrhizobium sp. USDA 4541 TaxID=2817704 RepID=UPI0028125562|nr:methyltransferase [Bradyrhizobium sp. USDA 4541]
MPKTIAVLGSALFFAVAPSSAAGLVPWWITRWEFRPPFFDLDATRAVGILLIAAGLPRLVDSFARFALQGLGTPAPVALTQNLVVTGLYRYVRNPIYVALVAVILGQAVLFGDQRLGYGVGVARLPRVCRGVRGAGARSYVRNGVRGFPGQCPALDSAAHGLASRTTPESFVTRAPPREGRGTAPCRKMARPERFERPTLRFVV